MQQPLRKHWFSRIRQEEPRKKMEIVNTVSLFYFFIRKKERKAVSLSRFCYSIKCYNNRVLVCLFSDLAYLKDLILDVRWGLTFKDSYLKFTFFQKTDNIRILQGCFFGISASF